MLLPIVPCVAVRFALWRFKSSASIDIIGRYSGIVPEMGVAGFVCGGTLLIVGQAVSAEGIVKYLEQHCSKIVGDKAEFVHYSIETIDLQKMGGEDLTTVHVVMSEDIPQSSPIRTMFEGILTGPAGAESPLASSGLM